MQETHPVKKRSFRLLDYVIIVGLAVLGCIATNVFVACLIAIPIQLIHKITYGR